MTFSLIFKVIAELNRSNLNQTELVRKICRSEHLFQLKTILVSFVFVMNKFNNYVTLIISVSYNKMGEK